MKQKDIDPEEAMKQLQKIFKKRGTKALEMARKEILQEKIECKEAKEALTYFMTKYWHDVARPALLSLVCEAVGGDPELTTPIAVSMTLISGAIDIHDDIIDQSKHKGGRSTVYGKFGKDIALLVGDALLLKGLVLLNKAAEKGIPAEKMAIIIDIINNMFFELGDAEALELQFRGRLDVNPEEYLRIVRKKAADVEAHTRISAILGGGTQREIDASSEYGRILGMLMILRDDWIDAMDFKEALHRIKNECLPLPTLYVLHDSKTKCKISRILQQKKVTEQDVENVLNITDKAGGLKRTEKIMKELSRDADIHLKTLKISGKYLKLLIQAVVPGK
jgi:geranylgeranyl pyrophosphate synthase